MLSAHAQIPLSGVPEAQAAAAHTAAPLTQIHDWESLARATGFRPENMAALCGVSLRHLERIFAAELNQTPIRWARQLRCRLARDLISQGWSNKAVVRELGFSDEAHLCHEFQHFYGKPPRSFAPVCRPKFA